MTEYYWCILGGTMSDDVLEAAQEESEAAQDEEKLKKEAEKFSLITHGMI